MTNFKELSDKELLSTIICEHEGEMVSSQLLQSFPSLPGLLVDSVEEELMQIKGIGSKRARQIKAIYELSQRLSRYPGTKGRFIKCPQDLYDLLMLEMRFLKKEVFKAILLNTKNRILEVIDVSIGSLNSSIVHPREVYACAVKTAASGICFVHNHPSGDPEPSREDVETTQRLKSAGDVLGIKVLDHLVIGDGRYVSFKEQGLL